MRLSAGGKRIRTLGPGIAAHCSIIVNLLAGSLLGAWFGASWARRRTCYRNCRGASRGCRRRVADPDADPAVRDREIMVVADDAPEPRAWLQATDAPAILVRPDRYVLGAARSLQELNALAAVV
jgi:hypothetical protein